MDMKVLITNDDGILAPVLPSLIAFVRSFASEVVVVAPKVEQSGKSHAIDFTRPIEIKRVDIAEGARCYSMDSTPADCVRYAVLGLKETFDLVISGINRGYNLGADLVYSGTAGAIFEAARLGIKGDAISSSISAASILAKVTRDRLCLEHDRLYPGYGIAGHKGYPTAAHMEAVRRLGPSPIHRRSFLKFLDK